LGREGLVDRLGARQIVKVAARDILRDGGPPGGFLVLVEELCVKNKVFPFFSKNLKKKTSFTPPSRPVPPNKTHVAQPEPSPLVAQGRRGEQG